MLDASGSIDTRHFALIKSFVARLVSGLDRLESGRGRVGLLTFADDARLQFSLGRYATRASAAAAIAGVQHSRGTTNTAAALRYVRESMFTRAGGARDNVPDVLVVLTDGGSNDKRRTQVCMYDVGLVDILSTLKSDIFKARSVYYRP